MNLTRFSAVAILVILAAASSPGEGAANPSNAAFQRLWSLGTLDPARASQWPALQPGPSKLENLPVAPLYILHIARADPAKPSSMECYEVPELTSEQTFVPRWGPGMRLTLMIDLGRTMPGTLEFEAKVPVGTKITVETGEAMLPLRTYPVAPEAKGEFQVFRPVIANAGWTSLRFAWIHFDNPSGPVILRRMNGLYRVFPSNYVGDFSCSDEMLTRIWEMCAYSAHAVMVQSPGRLQTMCLDRVDRFPWIGDSRIIQTAVCDVFGQYSLVRSNLEGFLAKGTRPIPDLNSIAPYTLDWALAAMDYYQRSGDAAFLQERLDDLTAIIDKYDALPPRWEEMKRPADATLWMFFDWDKRIGVKPDAQTAAAFAGKYVQTCRTLAESATFLNRPEIAQHATELARKHTAQWREWFLGGWNKVYGVHAVTNLLLGDILSTPEEKAQAYDRAFADRRTRWTGSPYFGTHVLSALAKVGRQTEGVEMLKDYWGTMIDAGATTVWEEWSPNTRLPVNAQPPQFHCPDTWAGLSLIQSAGVGPVRWLFSEIAGITPETPGFQRVRIEPHPCGLTWAKGTLATPLGPVSVQWEDQPGQFLISYSTPETCQGVTVAVPAARQYTLDGGKIEASPGINGTVLLQLPRGKHEVRCEKTRE